ncbi:efflux RND transporter periplasmic adaptor subunit [Paraflavisolibacter sp. H34]|uniref:efflux RND transporter periplasmic adaptor subunit n=1 Tax=Huijunlia imazamoxiresistens TaxID=3127457 RepID=UPI003018061C
MKWIYYGSLAPLAFVLMTACSVNSQADKTTNGPKPELPVARLETRDTALQRTYVADIQAVQNVEVRNRVGGFLEQIYVDEGQLVQKGQPLFGISNKEYKTQVAKAKASLTNAVAEARSAEVEVGRVALLVEKKVITPSDLEVAKARHQALEAKVEEARSVLSEAMTKLSYTSIRAPFTGIINRIPLKKGSLLDEGALLTTVSDISSVYTYFNIAEDEYLRYLHDREKKKQQGPDRVRLVLADGSLYDQAGAVETIAGEFEESTGSIAFRARFPNPGRLLKHGASGKVVLQTSVEDALLVPQKSVFEIQDKNYVYVVDGANKVKMRSFVPRTRVAQYYVVQSGLQPGDRVVYEGVQSLRDGMQIIPRTVSFDSGM